MDNIITITFSKATSLDMKNRFEHLFSSIIDKTPLFSTIHSFCYNIIINYYSKNYIPFKTVLIEKKKIEVIKNIYLQIYEKNISHKELVFIKDAISKIKNRYIDEDEILLKYKNINIKKIYTDYNIWLNENHFIDFDDIIIVAFKIITTTNFYKENYSHCKYINVDEVQDTSLLQHKLIQAISIDKIVFMVGDEDQSIYENNNIDYITNFENYYNNTSILKIEENFRCPLSVVNNANLFIKNNRLRNDKDMFSNKAHLDSIRHIKINNYKNQYSYILDIIKKTPINKTIAIIYKNNYSSIPIINMLDINNIEFKTKNHDYQFLSSAVINDILNYIYLAINQYDINLFLKIYDKLGYPSNIYKYLNKNNELTIWEQILKIDFLDEDIFRKTVIYKKYFSFMSRVKSVKAIDIILYKLGYYSYLSSFLDNKNIVDSLYKINIAKQLAINTKDIINYAQKLKSFEFLPQNKNSNLSLLTIHSSKGMEFDIVVLIDTIDGILPNYSLFDNYKLFNDDNIEKERRLFYVAVTRTKEMLYLISSNRIDSENVRSSFIDLFLNKSINLTLKNIFGKIF